jgi:hypothetical protein
MKERDKKKNKASTNVKSEAPGARGGSPPPTFSVDQFFLAICSNICGDVERLWIPSPRGRICTIVKCTK